MTLQITKSVACRYCDETFPSAYYLRRHRIQDHPKHTRVLPCTRCDRSFTHPTALRMHEQSHDSFEPRFFAKVRMTSECWIWTGGLDTNGYGHILAPDGDRRWLASHVVAYENIVGPVPDGLELDHLCRNPLCCRPEHLEPVTRLENMRRAWKAREMVSCPICGKECLGRPAMLGHVRMVHEGFRPMEAYHASRDAKSHAEEGR